MTHDTGYIDTPTFIRKWILGGMYISGVICHKENIFIV